MVKRHGNRDWHVNPNHANIYFAGENARCIAILQSLVAALNNAAA